MENADGIGKVQPSSAVGHTHDIGASVSPVAAGLTFPFDLQARLLDAQVLPELLDVAASMLARVPGTVGAWIYQRDASGRLVLVRQWRATHAEPPTLSGDILGGLIHQRWIAAHRLGHSVSDFAQPFVPAAYPSALVVPMLIGEELVGALAVERRAGDVFPYAPEDVVALASIAAETAQSMQMIVLRQRAADQARTDDREEALDQERRRIARELHDGIVQDLAYLRLRLEMLTRVAVPAPERVQSEITEVCDQINRSISGLRETIGTLRRPRPPVRGITGQLRELATDLGAGESALELDLSELRGVSLAPEVERAMVGIVREALQNIRKHAQASSVRVEVQREADDIHLVVADDGVGIPGSEPLAIEGHFGMEQMRELAEDMGGSLEVESGTGGGTRVHARIPLGQGAQTQ